MANKWTTLLLLPLLLSSVLAVIVYGRPIIFYRSFVYGLLLPFCVSLFTVLLSLLIDIPTGGFSSIIAYMVFVVTMGVMMGFPPAILVVLTCDILWINHNLRYRVIPVFLGGFISLGYAYFFLDEGRLESLLLFAFMGCLGGFFFLLLRQRLIKITNAK